MTEAQEENANNGEDDLASSLGTETSEQRVAALEAKLGSVLQEIGNLKKRKEREEMENPFTKQQKDKTIKKLRRLALVGLP